MLCEDCGKDWCCCAKSVEHIDAWADVTLGDTDSGLVVDGADMERLWRSREADGQAALQIVHPQPDPSPQAPVTIEDLESVIR